MNLKYLFFFLLLPLPALCQPLSKAPSIVHSYSNDSSVTKNVPIRNIDFPTQIIRMSENIKHLKVDCDHVHQVIDEILVQNIRKEQFTYNIYIVCEFDPNTKLAKSFKLHSYFDPIDDKGVEYLLAYLNEYNGSDILGTKLHIESAKGLVISLNIIAGFKNQSTGSTFMEYRKDRSNFYFKSNFDMKNKLITDIYEHFFSNNPELILPFINKWFNPYSDIIYKRILKDSNYVELQPERIFLMDSGSEIFISDLKHYYTHHCNRYENKRCLNL